MPRCCRTAVLPNRLGVFALHQVRLALEIERDEARDRPEFSRRSLLQGVDRVGRTRLE